MEFCTCLELCEPSAENHKNKKSPKSENAGKRKADTPTKPVGKKKFNCNMHGRNKTHDTKDCFELKWRMKHAKQGKTCTEANKVTYKDLNAFIKAKVTAALKKAKKNLKQQKKEKQVELNAFGKFRMLNVNKSSNNKDKQYAHVSTNVDDGSNIDSK